ncbi:OmpA family protein [Carboxylicivirga marina]|uniref:OmpA family protein n=1 Tax=Carboxylicivirga marina TaxID=2800988 RepID=A0ABS1HEC3_9BACT|nr:OmpA family protein [Carboxylicivirga marina]MBK3516017.1 OmpA family protein [Carboxylicivirga marina]
MKNFIYISLSIVFFSSCIPLKQFEDTVDENKELQSIADEMEKDNDALKVENRELSSDLSRYKKKVELLAQDTARLGRQNRRLQHRYDDLNKNYADVLGGLKATSTKDVDNKKLLTFLQQLQDDLQQREDALIAAEQELNDKKRRLGKAEAELQAAQQKLEEQNKRLVELEDMLFKKEEAMRSLKQSISNALKGFSDDELQVHMRNGMVYVSLEEKLLYQSGKYDVNEQGVTVLKKIAAVLEKQTDIAIVVEGHTDNVPYKGRGELNDNWDLSVKRATSVVRIIMANSSIDPYRITAAGRSEFAPVTENNSTESLRKNRRTEIIITPRWREVFQLLEMEEE